MSGDEYCGFETADGTPCRNLPTGDGADPERCYLPSHNGRDDDPPNCVFDEHRDAVLDAARAGATKEGIARAAGIHKDTLYRWLADRPEFERAFRQARWQGEKRLLADADDRGARFILERSYDYVKTEKREIQADVTERQAATETDDYEVLTDDGATGTPADENEFRYQ